MHKTEWREVLFGMATAYLVSLLVIGVGTSAYTPGRNAVLVCVGILAIITSVGFMSIPRRPK
jgi:hypothetical protein